MPATIPGTPATDSRKMFLWGSLSAGGDLSACYSYRRKDIPDHPLPLTHAILLASGFRVLVSQRNGLVVLVSSSGVETESENFDHEQCDFIRKRLGFSMCDDNVLHLLCGVDGVRPCGFGDTDVWRIRLGEELFDGSWASCAELPAWRCQVLCIGKAWSACPAGDMCAIDILEDRGGGLPGQDGVGVDDSGATHWFVCMLMVGS